PTSHRTARARRPFAPISPATAVAFSACTSALAPPAPSSANASATDLPIPAAPPVTIAILPASLILQPPVQLLARLVHVSSREGPSCSAKRAVRNTRTART